MKVTRAWTPAEDDRAFDRAFERAWQRLVMPDIPPAPAVAPAADPQPNVCRTKTLPPERFKRRKPDPLADKTQRRPAKTLELQLECRRARTIDDTKE